MTVKLPDPIETHFSATNASDPDAFLSCFSDDIHVTDEGKDYYGIAAVKKWGDLVYFGYNLRLEVTKSEQRGTETVVTAKCDGTYDKTGLPDPLFLDFHFTLEGEKIKRLHILPASVQEQTLD